MKIEELTQDDLRALIHEAVEAALLDLIGDPDADVALRDEVHTRLQASLQRVQQGERGIPLDDVAARLE